MTTFREWVTETLAPARLKRTRGARFVYAIGLIYDVASQAVVEAVRARFASTAPADALPYIGAERGIQRGPSESETSYRERLRTAWTAWSHAGEDATIVAQLAIYGVQAVTYGSELVMEYPVDVDNWSRFWIALEYGSYPWTGAPSATVQEDIRRIILQWKPAHWICPEVVTVTSSGDVTWQRVQDLELTWADLEDTADSGLPRDTWATSDVHRFTV